MWFCRLKLCVNYGLRKNVYLSFTRRHSYRNMLKLKARGMYQDVFPENSDEEIVELLKRKGPQCVYSGFDPTADSLHIGNLLVLVNLLHWQRAGHHVILLVGGATGRIGDPSGRTADRPVLEAAHVDKNACAIRKNIEQVFNNHKHFLWKQDTKLPDIRIVNNMEWYEGVSAVELVGSVGRHMRMGAMLSRHSVHTRLSSSSGMSFAEFCYQLFQSYDWLKLLQLYDCRFQVGGNDQMGNIVSGHDLISRVTGTKVYGLTLPLVTTESGDKFGKSAGNAIWLDPRKTSPFDLYQFFMRVKDCDVEKLLKLFTFESLGVITALMDSHKPKPELRSAQQRLAELATLLVHGEEGLESAQQVTKALYKGDLQALSQLSAASMCEVLTGSQVQELLLQPGITMLQLAMKAQCFLSESDARRIISAGGFYVNHQRASNTEEVLSRATHILPNNTTLLRVGKKNYYIVKWLT